MTTFQVLLDGSNILTGLFTNNKCLFLLQFLEEKNKEKNNKIKIKKSKK